MALGSATRIPIANKLSSYTLLSATHCSIRNDCLSRSLTFLESLAESSAGANLSTQEPGPDRRSMSESILDFNCSILTIGCSRLALPQNSDLGLDTTFKSSSAKKKPL